VGRREGGVKGGRHGHGTGGEGEEGGREGRRVKEMRDGGREGRAGEKRGRLLRVPCPNSCQLYLIKQ
jgi:hypothetical protein